MLHYARKHTEKSLMMTSRLLLLLFLVTLLSTPVHTVLAGNEVPTRKITIKECVEIALRNNIDIAVSLAEKEIGATGVPIEEAAFLPKFTGEWTATRSVAPTGSALDGSLSVDQRAYKLAIGASELLSSGATVSLSLENQRAETSSAASLLSPQYTTGLALSARQPLLKNAGKRVTEAPLHVARAGAIEKTEEWKSMVTDIIATVRTAFLSYSAVMHEVEVRNTAVELAKQMVDFTEARIAGGAAATMDRLPAESAVATRKEEQLRAEAAAQTAEVELKNILGIKSAREWDERFVPAPLSEDIPPPEENDSFEEAIHRRPEVAALIARKTKAEIQEVVAGNRTLPSLDLTVSAGLSGLSGTPNPSPLFPSNSSAFSGNYGDSIDQMFSGRYRNLFVGLKSELPWHFGREKAEWRRAQAFLREQSLLEEAMYLRIRVEIRKSRLDLESALARIGATRLATQAAERKLEAEEKKLSVGRSTTVEVLRFQQDVSEARLVEIKARIDTYGAQTRLWRAIGTILEKEGIVLQ